MFVHSSIRARIRCGGVLSGNRGPASLVLPGVNMVRASRAGGCIVCGVYTGALVSGECPGLGLRISLGSVARVAKSGGFGICSELCIGMPNCSGLMEIRVSGVRGGPRLLNRAGVALTGTSVKAEVGRGTAVVATDGAAVGGKKFVATMLGARSRLLASGLYSVGVAGPRAAVAAAGGIAAAAASRLGRNAKVRICVGASGVGSGSDSGGLVGSVTSLLEGEKCDIAINKVNPSARCGSVSGIGGGNVCFALCNKLYTNALGRRYCSSRCRSILGGGGTGVIVNLCGHMLASGFLPETRSSGFDPSNFGK